MEENKKDSFTGSFHRLRTLDPCNKIRLQRTRGEVIGLPRLKTLSSAVSSKRVAICLSKTCPSHFGTSVKRQCEEIVLTKTDSTLGYCLDFAGFASIYFLRSHSHFLSIVHSICTVSLTDV